MFSVRSSSISAAAKMVSLSLALAGQSAFAAHSVEIQLPAGIASETVFIRYAMTGETLGGWVEPRAGVSSYVISTALASVISTALASPSVKGIKAVIYTPGCAFRTLDLTFSNAARERYAFVCEPLPTVGIAGKLSQPGALGAADVKVEARYIARWAGTFLGLDRNLVTVVRLGETQLAADGRFRISVPDLLQDPLASSGEVQIWSKGDKEEQLIPVGKQAALSTRMAGLPVRAAYFSEIPFAEILFALCRSEGPVLHTSEGFAIRNSAGPCVR